MEAVKVDKPLEKLNFNILFVSDNTSRLNFARGEVVLKNFSIFYEKYANTTVFTANSRLRLSPTHRPAPGAQRPPKRGLRDPPPQ